MRAQRLYSRLTMAWRFACVRGGTPATVGAVWTALRHASAEAVLTVDVHANTLYNDGSDAPPAAAPEQEQAEGETGKEQRPVSLVSQLLPYVYSSSGGAGGSHLALPIDQVALRRIKKIMNTKSRKELADALHDVRLLETPEDCNRYVNLIVSYIRQQARAEEQAQSACAATRQRAAHLQRRLWDLRLSGTEKRALIRKACTLVEERRVPLVVASRLLRYRWPSELSSVAGGDRQPYVMDLVRCWATEELQTNAMDPQGARALLNNCAFALKSVVRRRKATESLSGISSFIGALATTASQDLQSPAKAEGIISLMWSVHSTGCPAPATFWDAMVQRVVSMNEALGGELATDAGTAPPEDDTSTPASALAGPPPPSPAPSSTKAPRAGHFFSTLSTRQLYRFLKVLKLVKWDGDPTVLHLLADQTLRNVAFELEAANFDDHSSGDSEGAVAAAKRSIEPFSFVSAAEMRLSSPPRTLAPLPKSVAARRIQQVADLQTHEFLELLQLAGELGVPFGVSATRMADELLIPLVPYLNAKQLILLLQVVRHTRSQSPTLLQAVIDRLVQRGTTAAYALPLAKAALKTAAKAPAVFQNVHLDDFAELFSATCEAQHTLVRAAEVAAMGDLLYTLSRRYEETSPQGQRIREVVNLLCAQVDRLLQLQVTSSSNSDRLLECTVLLRMRANKTQYPAVQELLASRAVAIDREECRREAHQKQVVKRVDALNTGAAGEQTSHRWADSPRWEDLSEDDLPQVTRAALSVYSEFVFMFERMVTVKAELAAKEFELFAFTMKKAGLYSILQGAQLFQQGHLESEALYTPPSSHPAAQRISRTLPSWIDKTVTRAVLAKLSNSRISPSDKDDDVLKVLGHVHCDTAKVDSVIAMMARSPLRKLQRQRSVWLYIAELTRRFGSAETKEAMRVYLNKALHGALPNGSSSKKH
ncbi:hypothetical protein LSCM1_01363 [Leishmania martiniquensis]|uniref:Uncharacterized protein n=1 Tax=Leishmania martiniquensis TaxID=1580590 RepID=A0A836KCH1_9TRYP|nr:hypothetical protein LSCM1_01363 [Leishmania martiniquensis]